MSIDTTIERILDAALVELAQGGARRTTMNQIADAAGLGVATVYRRFPRKAQLVEAVLVREAQRIIAEVDAAIEREDTVEDQSAAGFTVFAHAVSDRPFLVRLMRGDDDNGGETFRAGELADQVMVLVRDYLARFVRDLQSEGRYLGVDADIVAEIQARLALSLILAPEGRIPMHDDAATRAFATKYLVPLLGAPAAE
ncbi:TetR/AcrR family transcriptional regulator [Nocardioides sp. MH1]|uniref:TetR/AcrR family transcriptional regulator n=1 Tax=Nocardioides sp. MH1 TaxID=3242490 RepID=UPI003522548C